jgi:hypothetical protein
LPVALLLLREAAPDTGLNAIHGIRSACGRSTQISIGSKRQGRLHAGYPICEKAIFCGGQTVAVGLSLLPNLIE